MGRANKARLAVCSNAIVKRECLVFVFLAIWMVMCEPGVRVSSNYEHPPSGKPQAFVSR